MLLLTRRRGDVEETVAAATDWQEYDSLHFERAQMMRNGQLLPLVLSGVLASFAVAGEVKIGQAAPSMLPLVLSDGSVFDPAQASGKLVVLYFYEQDCPRCRGAVPDRNKWIEEYKGKPVRFIAVGAGDTSMDVQGYIADTRLQLPTTPDPLSLLEKSWGVSISLNNIWQTRVIGPDGVLGSYAVGGKSFDSLVESATWKYPREDYDPALWPVVDRFEWGEYDAGAKLLKSAKRSSKKPVAESAAKFADVLSAECKTLVDEASGEIESNPVSAYDKLTRVATIMEGDPLAKDAQEKLKTLKANAAVKDELAARKMLGQLVTAVARAKPGQERQVGSFAESIIKKYPETPTAKRVEQVVAAWK
jgi:thiol-disulfide isomerase/thioredoxin